MIPKAISIKGTGCRFGSRVRKVVELTSGDLCRVPQGAEGVRRFPDRDTEVSRGHSSSWRRIGS
jgi:hypothetical protein